MLGHNIYTGLYQTPCLVLTNIKYKLTIRCTLPWSQPHPLFSEIRASNFSDLVYKPDPGGAGILQEIVSCTFHSIWWGVNFVTWERQNMVVISVAFFHKFNQAEMPLTFGSSLKKWKWLSRKRKDNKTNVLSLWSVPFQLQGFLFYEGSDPIFQELCLTQNSEPAHLFHK